MDSEYRQSTLQRHRLRMTLMSVVNGLLQSGILALYAWQGSVPWDAVLAFLLASLATSLAFAMLIKTGHNLRLRDQGMLTAQLITSLGIQLIFMVIIPQVSFFFLVSILVFFNFAMLSFGTRQYLGAWLFIGVVTGIALYLGRDRFGYPGKSYADIAILWLFFFLAIRSLTTIGVQYSVLRAKLSEKNEQLQAALERNQELASRDELTGIYNRRCFMAILADERERANRTGDIFCVALMDLDHFKLVNDRYGHLTGDAVLRTFAGVVQASMRTTDRFARYGGEEFVLLLTATTPVDTALIALERIRVAVEGYNWDELGPGLRVTVSSGVTAFRPPEQIGEMLDRADQGLYEAKHAGRNRIGSK